MKRNQKAIILAASALLSLAAAFSLAQQNQSGSQDPSYKGSIPVQENLTSQQYQALAKVSMADAIKAAQTALNPTAAPSTAKLSVENGYLVWEVVIGDQEVKVDAGNAQVLHKEAVGAGDEGDGENEGEGQGEGE